MSDKTSEIRQVRKILDPVVNSKHKRLLSRAHIHTLYLEALHARHMQKAWDKWREIGMPVILEHEGFTLNLYKILIGDGEGYVDTAVAMEEVKDHYYNTVGPAIKMANGARNKHLEVEVVDCTKHLDISRRYANEARLIWEEHAELVDVKESDET